MALARLALACWALAIRGIGAEEQEARAAVRIEAEGAQCAGASAEGTDHALREWLRNVEVHIPEFDVELGKSATATVRNLVCTRIDVSRLAVAEEGERTIGVRVQGLAVGCAADWHVREAAWPHVQADGGVTIALEDAAEQHKWEHFLDAQPHDVDAVRFDVDIRDGGEKELAVPDELRIRNCSAHLAVTHLHFSGEAKWVLEQLKDLLATQLAQFLTKYICDQVREFVQQNGTSAVRQLVAAIEPYARAHVPPVFPPPGVDGGFETNGGSSNGNATDAVRWQDSAYMQALAFVADDVLGAGGARAAIAAWARQAPESTAHVVVPNLWHADIPLPSRVAAGSLRFHMDAIALSIPIGGSGNSSIARFAPLVLDGATSPSAMRGRLALNHLDVEVNLCVNATVADGTHDPRRLIERFAVRAIFRDPLAIDAAVRVVADAHTWAGIQPTQFMRDVGDCVVPALYTASVDGLDAHGLAPSSVMVQSGTSKKDDGRPGETLEAQIDDAVSTVSTIVLREYGTTLALALRGALDGPWRDAANALIDKALRDARAHSQPTRCPIPSQDAPHWGVDSAGAGGTGPDSVRGDTLSKGAAQVTGYTLVPLVLVAPILVASSVWLALCLCRCSATSAAAAPDADQEAETITNADADADEDDGVRAPLLPSQNADTGAEGSGLGGSDSPPSSWVAKRRRMLRYAPWMVREWGFPPKGSLAHQACVAARTNGDDLSATTTPSPDAAWAQYVRAAWAAYAAGIMLVEIALVAGLFLSSNLSVGAEIGGSIAVDRVSGGGGGAVGDALPVLFEFSLKSSVQQMWDSHVYFLALLIGVFSGLWPYVKLACLAVCWLLPVAAEEERGCSGSLRFTLFRRKRILRILDALGRWSLVDCMVMAMMIVAFRVTLDVEEDMMQMRGDSNSGRLSYMRVDLAVSPGWGIYGFVIAAGFSLLLSSTALRLHYLAEERGDADNAGPDEGTRKGDDGSDGAAAGSTAEPSSSIAGVTDSDSELLYSSRTDPDLAPSQQQQSHSCRQLLLRHGYLGMLAAVACALLIASLGCFLIGIQTTTVRITFEGATGWLLEASGRSKKDLSLSKLAAAISADAGAQGAWSRHGARLLQVVFIATTIVAPIAKLVLHLLWTVLLCLERMLCPSARAAARSARAAPRAFASALALVSAAAEHARAFDSLDAFLVSVFAAVLELSAFAHAIVGHNCDALDKVLARYTPVSTCFAVDAHYHGGGAWLLLTALLLGWAGEAAVNTLSDSWHEADHHVAVRQSKHRRRGSELAEREEGHPRCEREEGG